MITFFIGILLLLLVIFLIVKITNPKPVSVAIVTLMKNPHQLPTWIQYHQKIGVDAIYIYLDDPTDVATINLVKNFDSVKLIVVDDKWKSSKGYKEDPSKDQPQNWNVRQDLAVNDALLLSSQDSIDVLLHIDADELLLKDATKTLSDIFSKYSQYDTFKFKNIEIAPHKTDYQNCFTEAKFFRTDPSKFIAYGNGKGGGRVGKVKSNGPHEMLRKYGKTVHGNVQEIVVLHYVSCNETEFLKKYQLYGDFKDSKWEWATFHLNARDQLKSCTKNSCKSKINNLFKSRMLKDGEQLKYVNIDEILKN